MKMRTIIDTGGSSLLAPVDTYTISPETLPQHGARHGGVVETRTSGLNTDVLVTTITFPDDDVVQISTYLGELDPSETSDEHVERHLARVLEVIEAWP
jgi:hypothetical protein